MTKRIVFFGTPEIAVPSLRALDAAGMEIVLVVARPDQPPRRRGQQPIAPPVKAEALRRGFEVFQPQSANAAESVERLRAAEPDVGVTVAYGEILRTRVLSIPRLGFINVHPSLLPKYRGSAPIHWAMLCGDPFTGVSIIRMDPRMDSGPILSQVRVEIASDDNAGLLHDRLAEVGAELLVETVRQMADGEPAGTPQDPSGVTLAPKLNKDDGWVDWQASAWELECFVRAMTPWPGAFSELHYDQRARQLVITLLHVCPVEVAHEKQAEPGTITHASTQELFVATGNGTLAIVQLKPAGKRAMSVSELLCGYNVEVGDRFVSPAGASFEQLLGRSMPRGEGLPGRHDDTKKE